MKKLLLSIALGSICAFTFAQGKDLKVAIDPTYEPFTFKTADGKPTGFDVDIASALCEQIKRKCVFVEQVWDSMIPGLQAKKYDVIISSCPSPKTARRSSTSPTSTTTPPAVW
jgi:arginine/ornithine transport system substrate-binding protein